jgi:hypothetical protein
MPDYKKAKLEAQRVWSEMFLDVIPLPILEVAESYGLTVPETDFLTQPNLSGILDTQKGIIYINRSEVSQISARYGPDFLE